MTDNWFLYSVPEIVNMSLDAATLEAACFYFQIFFSTQNLLIFPFAFDFYRWENY